MKAKLQTMLILVLLNTLAYAGKEGDILVMNAGSEQRLLEAGCDSRSVVDGYPATPPPSPVLTPFEKTNPPLSPGQKRKIKLPRQSSLEKVEEVHILKEVEKLQNDKKQQPTQSMSIQKKTIKVDFFSYLTLKIVVEIERKFKDRAQLAEKFIANFKQLSPVEQQTRINAGTALCGRSGRLHPAFRSLSHEELTACFKRIDSVTFTTQ